MNGMDIMITYLIGTWANPHWNSYIWCDGSIWGQPNIGRNHGIHACTKRSIVRVGQKYTLIFLFDSYGCIPLGSSKFSIQITTIECLSLQGDLMIVVFETYNPLVEHEYWKTLKVSGIDISYNIKG